MYILSPSFNPAIWPILPVYLGSEYEAEGCGYFCLSNKCCLIEIPVADEILAGVKSLIVFQSELSKNLINLIKSFQS